MLKFALHKQHLKGFETEQKPFSVQFLKLFHKGFEKLLKKMIFRFP
jgi:hypothetical protein